jgi:HK97 family phage portal protein
VPLFGRLIERRDSTFQTVWGADLDNPAAPFNTQRVTREQVIGLSAVFACVRLLTDTVATLPLHAFRKIDKRTRIELDPQPEWIERPIPRDPSVTRVVHFQQVLTSLLLEGNSFTLALPNRFMPAELRVLDPRRVEMRRAGDSSVMYDVRDHAGGTVGTFDWTQIIHIPLIRLAGELRGLSPLEAERQLFSGAIAVEQLGERFAHNGLWLSGMVETAADLDETQATELANSIERKWSGVKNSGRVGVLTNGAKLTPLSVTPEQAQFLQTRQYDDERIFRIYRCAPSLMGAVISGAGSYALSAQEAVNFEKHTVRPLVDTIQPAYGGLMPPGDYLRFATKGLLKGDPKSQAELYHYALTDQWATRGEVRDWEDMPRFDDEAENGFLETPNNNAPGSPTE